MFQIYLFIFRQLQLQNTSNIQIGKINYAKVKNKMHILTYALMSS